MTMKGRRVEGDGWRHIWPEGTERRLLVNMISRGAAHACKLVRTVLCLALLVYDAQWLSPTRL